MLKLLRLAAICALTGSPLWAAPSKLDLKDGDRVLLIGDTLMERENNYGYLEARMRQEFPGRSFAVRNLAYSGDSPLGASRASFDPVDKGVDSLKQQLAVVRPTVAILGYGMAASLEDLTYRQNDPVLNPDPARYGLDHSPAKFRRELLALMDLIKEASPGGSVRFVFVGPVRHEDMRGTRPGLPDPAGHNALLAEYEKVIEQLAAEKQSPFVRGEWKQAAGINLPQGTDNGIHLTPQGFRALSASVAAQLGWKSEAAAWDTETPSQQLLRQAILRKNALFFHRSRPANYTYIFGFRKGEQGRNAVEIPKFDPLVDKAEANVIAIAAGQPSTLPPEPPSETKLPVIPSLPRPDFTMDAGLEMTSYAENPLLEKPVGMSWDADGRLWVATSNTYPQVNPDDLGAMMEGNSSKFGPSTGNDRIILLEDTNRDGVADVSRIVADKLLIPAGVAPDTEGGCFVGASTELLHLSKPGADGLLSERRIVLSGFGTEDTHHIIHGLHWGVDGRLYFQQTIYIHSHVETPWGLVRANSGVAFAYDPNTERLEVHSKGLVNCWGQQEDMNGQTFLTSGADGNGISWAFPGAVLPPSEGTRRTINSVSPGSYPKFCGFEIINSPLFGPEWQGHALTNDFRAHRIVRFSFNDLSVNPNAAEQKSGYVTKVEPDITRTEDAAFRPIALSMGPDGAIYVADWTNPIINHGEVDFRDPRRDREHGRIWRVSRKGAPLAKAENLAAAKDAELLEKLTRDHRHEREAAMAVLVERPRTAESEAAFAAWMASAKDGRTRLAALWLSQGLGRAESGLLEKVLTDGDGRIRAAGVRVLGQQLERIPVEQATAWLGKAASDEHPRVRLEAVRVLAKLPGAEPMDLAMQVLRQPMDRFLEYALWLNVRDRGDAWMGALLDGRLPLAGREVALDFALANLPPEKGIAGIRKLMPKPLPRDGSGPWLGLALKTADPEMLGLVYSQLLDGGFESPAAVNALRGLEEAVSQRQAALQGDAMRLLPLIDSGSDELAAASLKLGGALRAEGLLEGIKAKATDVAAPALVRGAAVDGLSHFASDAARDALLSLGGADAPDEVKRGAALALVRHHRAAALGAIRAVLPGLEDLGEARAFWQQALSLSGLSADLAKSFREQPLDPKVAARNLPAVPEIDEHADLSGVLRQQAGSAAVGGPTSAEVLRLAQLAAEKGDAVRGEEVYRRPALACIACHAIGGAGGIVGPDMTSIGASAPLDYLVESILIPAAKVKEGYHSVVIETKDGRTLMGRLLKSGGGSTVISDAAGQEITLADSAILKRSDSGSLMPANLMAGLSEQEQLDLFKFLSQLGKPGPFDATKSRAPRVWAVLPLPGAMPEGALKGEASLPWISINGTVNGTLLGSDVAPFASGAPAILAAARLQLSEAAEVVLTFPQAPLGVWADGQPVKDGRVRLEPGIHRIVVHHQAGANLRFESSAGTFLPSW